MVTLFKIYVLKFYNLKCYVYIYYMSYVSTMWLRKMTFYSL
jgi:hypothetical protein